MLILLLGMRRTPAPLREGLRAQSFPPVGLPEGSRPQPGGGLHMIHIPAELLHVSAVFLRQRALLPASGRETAIWDRMCFPDRWLTILVVFYF